MAIELSKGGNMADEIKGPVDLSELVALEEQIFETDGIIEVRQRELWQSGERLSALLDSYGQMRTTLQKAVWAALGLKVCLGCGKLKQADSFRYLYLEWFDNQKPKREIRALCTDCYNEVLEPAQHRYFSKRLPAELREEKFFILWDGRFRAFEEIFDEKARAETPVGEEPKHLSPALFTIGRSWKIDHHGFVSRIKKPQTQT